MADIFDKKEEVLDVILTREGRQFMAEGKFKPLYYEFYDSDIIYEAQNDEGQNASQERIEAGLYQKAISSIDQINDLGATIQNDNTNMLKNPLGSYQIQNEYAPAWQISFDEETYITGAFSTSQRAVVKTNINNEVINSGTLRQVNTNEERIPQFYVNVNYKLYTNEILKADGGTIKQLYFDRRNKDLLISLEEANAFEVSEPREFDIEIFKIIENNNGTDPYTLHRLYFEEDDFDSPESVEKYFNVLLDEEARFENNFKKKNIYTDISADPEELCETEQE